MFVSAILAAAGRGTRLGADTPKQLLPLGDRTILQRSFDVVDRHEHIDEIVIALPAALAWSPPPYLISTRKPVRIVDGGLRRQDSVAKAFAEVAAKADVIVIHDAARPLASPDLFSRVIEAAAKGGAATAAIQASDTVKQATAAPGVKVVARTLDRESIYLAQTPQAFSRHVLEEALAWGRQKLDVATDEALLAEQAGHPVRLVEGEVANIKITTPEDLTLSKGLLGVEDGVTRSAIRVGAGYDLHRLEPGRPLILGGVLIPYEKGLAGHSDADAVCHAVTDAILGAAAAGDIGAHFPDTDSRWKGANSLELLKAASGIVRTAGFAVSNIDAVIIAERPKLAPHIAAMRANLAGALGIDLAAISVKGKTNEQVDALGRNEAIAVHAVALVRGV